LADTRRRRAASDALKNRGEEFTNHLVAR